MAEGCEPTRPSEDEDEEREPLLPRVAWAQPRRGAPGSAVRLQEDEGAAVPIEPNSTELSLASGDTSTSVSFSAEVDQTHVSSSGATCVRPQPAFCAQPSPPCLSFLSPIPLWRADRDH